MIGLWLFACSGSAEAPAPVEVVPACGYGDLSSVTAAANPSTLAASAAAGPDVEAVTPFGAESAVRLDDGLHSLGGHPALAADLLEAADPDAPEVRGGALVCAYTGSKPYTLELGEQPPIVSAGAPVLTVAPVDLAAGATAALTVDGGSEHRIRFRPGSALLLRADGAELTCRPIRAGVREQQLADLLDTLDDAVAGACATSETDPLQLATTREALDTVLAMAAGLAGWDDPRIEARRPAADGLMDDLARRTSRSLDALRATTGPASLPGGGGAAAVSRAISCVRRRPAREEAGVRCTAQVQVERTGKERLALQGGWSPRFGNARQLTLVFANGHATSINDATFHQDGHVVPGGLLRLGEDQRATVDLAADLHAEPPPGPVWVTMADGEDRLWLSAGVIEP